MTATNETLQTIHALRTTHGNFGPQEVSDADLETIIAASVRAANASARQAYSIVVVRDRAQQKQLTGYAGSVGLLYCLDTTRLSDVAQHLGYPYRSGGIMGLITGATDTALAAQTAAIAARSLDIDSMFTNGLHRGDLNRVYEALDLPREQCFPLVMLILGYADVQPEHLKGRLAGPGVVHRGRYQRLTTDELDALVAAHADPEKHLGLPAEWRSADRGYLDWYYNTWLGRGGARSGVSQVQRLLGALGLLDE